MPIVAIRPDVAGSRRGRERSLRHAAQALARWISNHLDLHFLQHDRLQRATLRDLKQRGEVTVCLGPMEADVGLDSWPPEVPVEDRLGRLQTDALVGAAQQLAQALDRHASLEERVAEIGWQTCFMPATALLALAVLRP